MIEVQERILRATVEAAAVHGLTRLSVADVAKRAGLSRPTLYKHFESKDVLVAAAVQREAIMMMDAVRAVVDGIDEPRESLEAGVLLALRLVRDHPLLDRIVRTEPEVLVPLLTTDESMVLPVLRLPVEQMITAKFPELDQVVCRRVADMLIRLLVSYALSAPDDPPEVVAALVAGLVGAAGVLPTLALPDIALPDVAAVTGGEA
jgi:AcrR family transcriptional regulator